MASEDDKRPGTPRRDQWTKGNGDFNLPRCENNKAGVHGPVWSRCGVPRGTVLARLLIKMAVASFTSKTQPMTARASILFEQGGSDWSPFVVGFTSPLDMVVLLSDEGLTLEATF